MLSTLLLSWLLAAEPACRSECAATAKQATVGPQCPSTACERNAVAATEVERPAILSFEASWCGPCQQMKSVLARLKESGIRVLHVDVDREPELAREHRIRNLPSFVSVADGRPLKRIVGVCSYGELMGMVEAAPATAVGASAVAPGATHAEMLVRARYKLCPEKVDALTRFLEAFAAEDLEVRSDEGTLVVTASPEIQRAVGQMISAVVNRESSAGGCVSTAVRATGPEVHCTIQKSSACTVECEAAGCNCARCTNECGGECRPGCEDGVPRGVVVPDAPGVPLVPPVWMPQARSERLMSGLGINSAAGLVGRVILDEPAVPQFARRHRFEDGSFTLILTGNRELVDKVHEYINSTAKAAEPDAKSAKQPSFSFGFGEITR